MGAPLPLPPEMEDVKPDLLAMAAMPTDDAIKDDNVKKVQGAREATDGWLCGFCGATFAHRNEFKVSQLKLETSSLSKYYHHCLSPLQRHCIQNHTGKPFRVMCKWPGCAQEFKSISGLYFHNIKAHKKIRFPCHVCGSTYTQVRHTSTILSDQQWL